ncbi:MAG: hypothetical protein GY853_01335 [PVC group bacterium]|nr:hypothetical protein [PVC group bacterium]
MKKVYRYHIVYQLVMRKEDKAYKEYCVIELELFEPIQSTIPVNEVITEIIKDKIPEEVEAYEVQIFNYNLLNEYEVEDDEEKEEQSA